MRRARSPGGFTLIELMIALAITALVMAMVGGILVSTLEAQKHVEDKLQTEKTGYGVLTIIRRDLAGCYAYALGGLAFKGERASEGGEADKLSFVTTTEGAPDPQTSVRPKFQRVGYRCKADGNGTMSLYRRADPFTGGDPLQDGSFTSVASGLRSFALSYLDPKDKAWKDGAWEETDRLPLAVKITVELVPDPNAASTQSSFVDSSNAPRYQTIVGLGVTLAPAPDPSPSPGQGTQPGK